MNTKALATTQTQALVTTPELHPLCEDFPGLILSVDASEEQVDSFLVLTTEYTGSATERINDFLTTKNPRTQEVQHYPLMVIGVLVYHKEMNDQLTGETRPAIGVVFKQVDESTGEIRFLSFTSTSAVNFVKRYLFKTRGIGNWNRPLWIEVSPVQLQVGHTYGFKIVGRPGETVVEEEI